MVFNIPTCPQKCENSKYRNRKIQIYKNREMQKLRNKEVER